MGPRGSVAIIDDIDDVAYHGTDIYYATDGVNFTKAQAGPNPELLTTENRSCVASGPSSTTDPPQSEIGPVLAAETGFVMVTPAHPDNWSRTPACEPLLWFSEDGSRWTRAGHPCAASRRPLPIPMQTIGRPSLLRRAIRPVGGLRPEMTSNSPARRASGRTPPTCCRSWVTGGRKSGT